MTAVTGVTPSTVVRWTRRRPVKIIIDVGLLLGFGAEFITREGPDYAVHSWIGIILVPIIVLHLPGSLGWISRVWARKRQDRDFNLGVLNAVLATAAGVCIATGIPNLARMVRRVSVEHCSHDHWLRQHRGHVCPPWNEPNTNQTAAQARGPQMTKRDRCRGVRR